MTKDLEHTPVVVITGAASGIGWALANACIQMNRRVVLADIDEAALSVRESELHQRKINSEFISVVCDVSNIDAVNNLAQQTMRAFKRVDWLFNNAGISGRMSPVWSLNADDIRKVIDVNLYGVVNGVLAFIPYLLNQSHRSHIINIASFYGLCSGSNMAAYAMSKSAIVAFSEALFFDLNNANKPVDVSVACPSFVDTQLLANSAPSSSDELHRLMIDFIKRSRPAEDIAAHILAEVQKNTFYILPDREVKDYVEQRMNAIIQQTPPHQHNIERVMSALSKRINKNGC